MQMTKFLSWSNPPDLLKRFVNTRFSGTFCVDGTDIVVQSNDATVFEHFPPTETDLRLNLRTFRWKLVYDPEGPSEIVSPIVITHGSVSIANLGLACLFGIDSERGELVAFLGVRGGDVAFRETVLPLLLELTTKALRAPANSRFAPQLVPADNAHE